MAKLDYERDYYADLELPATADVADIKKQFKRLALKYHPDRNPGREDEVKDKFVVIQAAHEILTDPALKTKVDNYRRRPGSRFPTSSGVKGNPYQDLAKDMAERFGAPPTRRTQNPPRPAPTSTSSSSRYSGWVPPTAKQKMDASDNLRAWDRMRTASGRGSSTNGPSPTSPRPPTENTKPVPPPRTASQARRAEAAFGTKKTGYAPKSPLGGDEPPVTNNNYYSNINSRLFNETAESLKKPRPASVFVDPLSTQFGDNYSDDRQRTPYASHIGEKTNPFEGVSVNRAKSARDPFRGQSNSDDSEVPPRPHRQRSASVDESERFKKPGEKGPFEGKTASPRRQSKASARYSPHGTHGQEATSAPSTATFPPSHHANPPTNPTAGSGGTPKAKDGHSVYVGAFSSPSSNLTYSSSPMHPSPQSLHSNSRASGGNSHDVYGARYTAEKSERGPTTPSGARSPGQGMNKFEKGIHAQLQHLLSKLKMQRQSAPARDDALSPKRTAAHRVTKRTNVNPNTSFTIPIDEDTFGPTSPTRFTRHSTDNINTRFVAEEKAAESYMFNAGGEESPDTFLRKKQRSRSAPRGRQSPQRTGPQSSAESLNIPQQETAHKPSAFNPDEWGFEPHHFVPPPVKKPSTSPTRANRGAKKTRPIRQTAGTAGLVDDEDTSSEERTRPNTAADVRPSGAVSPTPMDIDTPPPGPIIPPVTGARTINVEPTKPEWRAGNVNGVNPTEGKTGNGVSGPKVLDPNKAGSEDAPDFIRPNLFADFKKVEPFAPPQPGLESLNDIAANLPFASEPSAKLHLHKDKPKLTLRQFPAVPVAPRSPTVLGVSSLKPSKQTWIRYVQEFEHYLSEWAKFNSKVLDHFQARKRVVDEKKFGWAVSGDTYGLQEYQNWLEEDRMVREKWVAACAVHEFHVREMSKNLERMNS